MRDGKLASISSIEDQSSDQVGLRIVVEIKRDAVGGAEQPLQARPAADQLRRQLCLSIVDGVPRTLRLDQMIRYYVNHQLDVIVKRTTYRLRKGQRRAHILRGLVKALDALDEVIATIRASETVDIARAGLIELLDIDRFRQAILDMQLRRLAALGGRDHRRPGQDRGQIARPRTSWPSRNGSASSCVTKAGEIVEARRRRRTRIVAADGEVSDGT